MNTTVRLSVLVGAGLLAGGLAAGPAQASPGHSHDSNDMVGYFADESDCESIADLGDQLGRWRDASCDKVNGGAHDGMWALTATWDDDYDGWVVRHDNFYDDNDYFPFDGDFPFDHDYPFDHDFPFDSGWTGFPFA